MFYDFIKRIIDIAGAIVLTILFVPIWIIIPILIKLDSKGPILYKPERVGKNGKIFKMFKFRSMKMFEINPRITKLGKILRQTSIDEMPQVFNIFSGEMSLVGPRAYVEPELEDAKKRYAENVESLIKLSLSAKPGLTGPWQVSGRNEIPWNQRVAIDADYAKRRSIIYDIYILFKTPFAMISKW
ncbi:MAG: Galactosyl transferase CpsE [Candidatus Collierbacteria bacterium GW2011_GWA2_42_17]|uniref:Galactosyl transferase CpsE n=1 Tax=Candidatus Collierbacteria bacterium GW2011_GWA2_42_17 TaxID=1618378 RepID=A0A0G1B858_9BACT|nr:MAG: Galactosyl transferase CpsE [Candidatus Collierbacteria bacterium GW2011_GWA2_42_17]